MTGARSASAVIAGLGMVLLSYAVTQLAATAGFPLIAIAPGEIPLFERWSVGASLGGVTSVLVGAVCPDRWLSRLAGLTTLIAFCGLLVVVVFAP